MTTIIRWPLGAPAPWCQRPRRGCHRAAHLGAVVPSRRLSRQAEEPEGRGSGAYCCTFQKRINNPDLFSTIFHKAWLVRAHAADSAHHSFASLVTSHTHIPTTSSQVAMSQALGKFNGSIEVPCHSPTATSERTTGKPPTKTTRHSGRSNCVPPPCPVRPIGAASPQAPPASSVALPATASVAAAGRWPRRP